MGIIFQFLAEVIQELRRVTWPTWRELYSYTLVVIATVIIIGAFISGADLVVTSLLQHFVYNVH